MKLDRKKILWAGLGLYALILFFFLTLYRLPADQLIAATTARASRGQVNIEAQRVAPILPVGYRLEDVSCTVQHGESLARDRLKSLVAAMAPT